MCPDCGVCARRRERKLNRDAHKDATRSAAVSADSAAAASPSARLGGWTALLLSAGPVVAASLLGQLATTPNIPTWYAGLEKPAFTPPNWVFAPVWTALYALMALAAWRLLRADPARPPRGAAIALFYGQLALNVAWSWMFFAAQSPFLGALNIVPQWIAILATILAARSVDRLAAWLLVPLLLWVGYAGALTFEIWRLNG